MVYVRDALCFKETDSLHASPYVDFDFVSTSYLN